MGVRFYDLVATDEPLDCLVDDLEDEISRLESANRALLLNFEGTMQ